MGEFEANSRQVISQEDFMRVADGLLAHAEDPSKDVNECLVSAQTLVQGLDDVKAGNLHVEPPLSEEQVSSYRKQSQLVIALGQKSVRALQATSERRGFLRRRQEPPEPPTPTAQQPARPAYSGTGSDAKK
ncbi:MAG TPA: hypothetical protein VN778_00335 [Verrucomicrobiae bacterium]|nr:hypothetical protein [Verrucomicrobiae bacterium]